MIFLSILGALLFYFFVYTLLNRYAQGEVLAVALNKHVQPIYVRLPPDTALHTLESLLIALLVYLAIDYGIALVRHSARRRGRRPRP